MAGDQLEDVASKTSAMAGSALGVDTLEGLYLRWRIASRGTWKSSDFKANQEVNDQTSPKYADSGAQVLHGFNGCFSLRPSDGVFVFADSGNKKKPGALVLQQKKSEMASTAKQTKVGTPDIKTLTGLHMNPFLIRRPSSAMTPERGWMASLFPVFVMANAVDTTVMIAAQAVVVKLLQLLMGDDDPGSVTVRQERKDLGTLIIDNQDFEQRILNGTVHST
tara:strand:- start:1697 stop:2359 length:663 start_codon:yes stop_codon:yes gene_type:complete